MHPLTPFFIQYIPNNHTAFHSRRTDQHTPHTHTPTHTHTFCILKPLCDGYLYAGDMRRIPTLPYAQNR